LLLNKIVVIEFAFLFILGSVIGSFLTAYTYRFAKGESVLKGRSKCPYCQKTIFWYDNIPILSYIFLGGRCRNCRKKISIRYPLIELFSGVLFVLCISLLGGVGKLGILNTFYYLLLTSFLISIFIVDFEHRIIPDEPVFLIFILNTFFLILFSMEIFYKALFFSLLASDFFLFLYFVTRKQGMGLGDVKLVLALSPTLVWQKLLVWLFVSFVIGSIVGLFLIALKKASFGKPIAFGPFLIVSYFATLFWGDLLVGLLLPWL